MNDSFNRRNILIGAGAVAVLAGAAFEGTRLLRKHHAPSPYDDLLSQLDDRDADALIGSAVLAGIEDFDAKSVAADVRARLKRNTLLQAVSEDANEDQLLEARGWVVPKTLGLLCALAAKAAV